MTRRATWAMRRVLPFAAIIFALAQSPASAHGVGGRTDLPVPVWMFSYAAGAAVIASFVALRFLWPVPRLRRLAKGRAAPEALERIGLPVLVIGRFIGLASLALVVAAAWFGSDDASSNIAPVALYVVFWIGLQFASALFGDVWALLNPFDTLAAAVELVRRRVPSLRASSSVNTRNSVEPGGQWTAAPMLLSFVWLELAYHDASSPTAIAIWISLYLVAVLIGSIVWGRTWLSNGEGFASLFGLLSLLSGIFVEDGRLRFRVPFSGLATSAVNASQGAVIMTVLGSTTFDGISRTELWSEIANDRTGWDRTRVATVGLFVVIALTALVYLAAMGVMGRLVNSRPEELALMFLHSLVPILFAYTMAHYFSLFIFEGQSALALLSDPLGRGWDLFGTATNRIDYTTVSVNTIAYVQVGTIVIGHVAGVIIAHDRSIERFSRLLAEVSQYPLLAVMVVYTIAGLGLLLG
jgi:hypothetical protein